MTTSSLLTINGGSSSIKFALFPRDNLATRTISGSIERIGDTDTTLKATDPTKKKIQQPFPAKDHADAATQLIAWLHQQLPDLHIAAIGHRIVHPGLRLADHSPITPDILAQLKAAEPLDLAHLPREIALIESFQKAFPTLPQIACLDTAFFHDLPHIAQLLPIPRKYLDNGIRKLGFHGLSYTYLLQQLQKLDPIAANEKLILAHLGSGASMAAIHHGKPVDTTMSFTPTAGLVMATRPGDLDPGLLLYLAATENLSPQQLDDMISHNCGLLGVSGTSSDMRDLEARQAANDPHAADAINLFCYAAQKQIGALVATLDGLDTLLFAGGIGEHDAPTRAHICKNFSYLGLRLDPDRNNAHAPVISTPDSKVTVRVIPTDEEAIMADILVHHLPPNTP